MPLFDDHDLDILSAAYSQACARLLAETRTCSERQRDDLAHHIIEDYLGGETSVPAIVMHALGALQHRNAAERAALH